MKLGRGQWVRRWLPTATVAAMVAVRARSDLAVNDPMDYGTEDMTSGYGSWADGSNNVKYESGIDGAWGGDADYFLRGSAATGGCLYAGVQGLNFRGAQRPVAGPLSGTFWVSVLIRADSVEEVNESGIVTLHDSASFSYANPRRDGFGVHWDGNARRPALYVMASASYLDDPSTSLPADTWLLFVAKLTVTASAGDSISLWVFDSASALGQTEASLGTPNLTSATAEFGDAVISLWAGGYGTSTTQFDEFRVSATVGDTGLAEVLRGEPIPVFPDVTIISIR